MIENKYHSLGTHIQGIYEYMSGILIPDRVDLKSKLIKRNKECHIILLKGIIHQSHIPIINIQASENEASTYIKSFSISRIK